MDTSERARKEYLKRTNNWQQFKDALLVIFVFIPILIWDSLTRRKAR